MGRYLVSRRCFCVANAVGGWVSRELLEGDELRALVAVVLGNGDSWWGLLIGAVLRMVWHSCFWAEPFVFWTPLEGGVFCLGFCVRKLFSLPEASCVADDAEFSVTVESIVVHSGVVFPSVVVLIVGLRVAYASPGLAPAV